ncbi:cytochrome P450 724B1-like isoform X1 [Pistacia vera]|uniref:cytochrome P450 724B1-like isoform X1 n=1 Tax=Pistacia vera TaxID=55513 RepID=UPI0012639EDC|nr:cytochrome P450 724B1-like isoform X1 [Pistacia vera]
MEELVFVILFLLLGLCLSLLVVPRLFAKREPKNLPPGTMGWPVFGETLSFLKPHRSSSMGRFLQKRCSRYGKVFKSHLYGSPAIVSCDPVLNLFVLQNEEKLFRASYPKPVLDVVGKLSLHAVSGELHKKLRNIAVSFITASNSNPLFLLFAEKLSLSIMDSWKEQKQISFCEETKKFTLYLMVKQLLSIEPEEPLAFKILEDFETYMKGFQTLPINIPGTAYAKALKASERLSLTVKEIIREREQDISRHREEDFLDVILAKRGLSYEETVSIVLDILRAGHRTTATLIALIVYFLANAPNVFQRLKEEHHAIRKNKEDGESLKWEDFQKMEFTNNVIHEATRCGNVAKFVPRKALQDVVFKDYFIPSGWYVFPLFTAVHLDPTLHENPSEFNPWRWTDYKAMSKTVMPFGGGPRFCPGAELAKVEISFFLHHLVLNYRWKIKADDFPVAYPYVEFSRGLVLDIEPTEGTYSGK